MAIRIAKVDATAAVAMVDLHVFQPVGPAAVAHRVRLDSSEDVIELGLANLEGVVLDGNGIVIVIDKVERQPVVDPYRRERRLWTFVGEAENAGEEPRRPLLVAYAGTRV